MARYIHLFETEDEFQEYVNEYYEEPWVSLTRKGFSRGVESFTGEVTYESGPAMTKEFNYWRSYAKYGGGQESLYLSAGMTRSVITSLDTAAREAVVDGHLFTTRDITAISWRCDGSTRTTGTTGEITLFESPWGTFSATTVNGTFFVNDYTEEGLYDWDGIDPDAMTSLPMYFETDHELQAGETVEVTNAVHLVGRPDGELAAGKPFRYYNDAEFPDEYTSEGGKIVRVGDTFAPQGGGYLIRVTGITEVDADPLDRVDYNMRGDDPEVVN